MVRRYASAIKAILEGFWAQCHACNNVVQTAFAKGLTGPAAVIHCHNRNLVASSISQALPPFTSLHKTSQIADYPATALFENAEIAQSATLKGCCKLTYLS